MRILISALTLVVCFSCRAFGEDPKAPFEVSLLSPRAVNLSPIYQAAVREATAHYRGDGDGIVTMTWSCDSSGHVRVWQLWPDSLFQDIFSPFLSQPFTLGSSVTREHFDLGQ
jgi:hypothetical protein